LSEKDWEEQERLAEKYSDILHEIDREFRRAARKIGVRKKVVAKRIYLPKAYITRLLEYPLFRQTWERKIFYRKVYAETLEEPKWMWIKIKTFPNLGGVPLEEAEKVKVEVEKEPRLRRREKYSTRG